MNLCLTKKESSSEIITFVKEASCCSTNIPLHRNYYSKCRASRGTCVNCTCVTNNQEIPRPERVPDESYSMV